MQFLSYVSRQENNTTMMIGLSRADSPFLEGRDMEQDITQKIKGKSIRYLIVFICMILLGSGILIYAKGTSSGVHVSQAYISYEKKYLQSSDRMMVQELHVSTGDHVKQGDLLVTVQKTFSDEDIQRLQQSVTLAQNNVNQLRAGAAVSDQPEISPISNEAVDAARSKAERMSALYEIGAVSAAKKEEAIREYEEIQSSVQENRGTSSIVFNSAALKGAEDQLNQAETLLRKAKEPS